jgi:hypothetical protein
MILQQYEAPPKPEIDSVTSAKRRRMWYDVHTLLDELIGSTEEFPLSSGEDKARLDLLKAKVASISVVYNE